MVYSPYVHTANCQGKDQNWAHFYFNSVPFALYVQTKAKMFPCKAQDAHYDPRYKLKELPQSKISKSRA